MKKYFILLLCLVAGTVNAFEGAFSFSPGEISSVNKSPTLFNFSDELLEAVKNCSSYQEDFTKNNPNISEIGALVGGDLSVYVDIKGQQNGKCVFDVVMDVVAQFGLHGKRIYHCQVDLERRRSLFSAMKDRSNEVVTETYETYSTLEDEDGNVVQKFPQKTTVTDNRFNIEWGKIQTQNCNEEQVEMSEAEQQKVKEEFDVLPESFVESLQNCMPDTASRTFFIVNDEINIKGWSDDKCILENEDFVLNVPREKLLHIQSWSDIQSLIQDKNICTYLYEKNYSSEYLLFAIDACSRSGNSMRSWSKTFNDVIIKTSLGYERNSGGCKLKFVNILNRNNQEEEDYSMVCSLSEEKVQEILQKYADLIDKYGEKTTQEGTSFSFSSAEPNDETNAASAEIMTYLKENNLCSMVQDKGLSADEKESISQEEEENL